MIACRSPRFVTPDSHSRRGINPRVSTRRIAFYPNWNLSEQTERLRSFSTSIDTVVSELARTHTLIQTKEASMRCVRELGSVSIEGRGCRRRISMNDPRRVATDQEITNARSDIQCWCVIDSWLVASRWLGDECHGCLLRLDRFLVKRSCDTCAIHVGRNRVLGHVLLLAFEITELMEWTGPF